MLELRDRAGDLLSARRSVAALTRSGEPAADAPGGGEARPRGGGDERAVMRRRTTEIVDEAVVDLERRERGEKGEARRGSLVGVHRRDGVLDPPAPKSGIGAVPRFETLQHERPDGLRQDGCALPLETRGGTRERGGDRG